MLKYETLLQLKSELTNLEYIAVLEDINNTAQRVISKPKTASWPKYMTGEIAQLNKRIAEIKTLKEK
tara:strand:+ start:44673 stop:44873 length:201 start_codon:yes stop_codon:yes gene_type:complete